MTCDERKDLLLLYAGNMLEPAEHEALRAHLATGCPACAGALAEAEATLAQIALAVTPVAPPTTTIDSLMKRIAVDDDRAASKPTSSMVIRRRPRYLAPLLAAAAAVAVTSGIWFYATRDARSFWRSTDLATVTLTSPTQPKATGQVWWDRDRQEWRVTVAQLGPTAPGREYELWVIPEGGPPRRSQTFQVDENGKSELVVKIPDDIGGLATAAITDEPIGGTDAPTGKVHLAGQFR